jgi:putative multiple sugar transport system substrate-binding protein
MKKFLSVLLCLLMVCVSISALAEGEKVGVSMPTKDLQRWVQDGENMEKELKAAGFEVELQYASNDVPTQLNQVETMVDNGCNVIVISAIEGSSLGTALAKAKEKGIKIIAYDRLLMDSDAVDYYATFDNYMVGTVQGNYVKEKLDLDNAEGPFYIEFTAGDPGDNNAGYFFNGAFDVLKPYIDSGKLVVRSGQTAFEQVATPTWKTDVAQKRADDILTAYYANGEQLDVWLCSNDSTALGVTNALDNYTGEGWPIITGQDCDIANTKNMIAGKQAMSVFKDTRTLAARVVTMIKQILGGEEVEVNDTETYNNNVITVPSYLCEPVFADANNYKELLIDSGYYTEDQLQ